MIEVGGYSAYIVHTILKINFRFSFATFLSLVVAFHLSSCNKNPLFSLTFHGDKPIVLSHIKFFVDATRASSKQVAKWVYHLVESINIHDVTFFPSHADFFVFFRFHWTPTTNIKHKPFSRLLFFFILSNIKRWVHTHTHTHTRLNPISYSRHIFFSLK